MALAIDVASTARTGTFGATSLTWSHTCTGADRALFVSISLGQSMTVTGITYNGVALTNRSIIANGVIRAEIWLLVAPTSGANNIIASFSGTASAVGGATSWTGVDPTTPTDSAVTASGNDTAPTVVASCASDQFVVDVVAVEDSGDGIATVGSGQTERWNQKAPITLPYIIGCGSTEAGAASVTMSWSLDISAEWATIALPIRPVGTPTPPPSYQPWAQRGPILSQ